MPFMKRIADILKSPKLRSLIEGGIDAAATPNIADGGATDFFRAMKAADAGAINRKLALIQPFVKQAQGYATTARGDKAYADIDQGDRRLGQEETKIGETQRHNKETEGLTRRGQDLGVNRDYQRTVISGVPYGMGGLTREGYERGETVRPVEDDEISPVVKANVEGREAGTDYTKQLTSQSQATEQATRKATDQADDKLDLERRRVDAIVSRSETARQKALQEAGNGGLPPKLLNNLDRLGGRLSREPAYQDMMDIDNGMHGVEVGLAQGNGFGDVTAINAFQRMVDPGATVRSEDVKLLQEAAGWLESMNPEHLKQRLINGEKLPQAVRERMMQTARELHARRSGYYNETVGARYKKLAEQYAAPFGVAPDQAFSLVGEDFSPAQMSSTPPAAGGTVAIQSGGVIYDVPAEMVDQFRASHPDAQVAQ